jgi:phage host-nuclease inhibitor protein Gam
MTYNEVNGLIEQLGQRQREIAIDEALMNEKIVETKAFYEDLSRQARTECVAAEKAIRDWCKAHRQELTDNGARKYHDFPAGRVIWRKDPPSVSVPKKGIAQILLWLHAHKLARFIRVKEELDKEAMLAEPDLAATVPEVRIRKGGERFVVEPTHLGLHNGDEHHA